MNSVFIMAVPAFITDLIAHIILHQLHFQHEANRYGVEVSIPDIKQRIRETENALSTLLGRSPGKIQRSRLSEIGSVEKLSAGLPAQLLRNRPDVQEAEMAFRASFENVNVAKSYFYPSLTITAEAGLSSLQLKNFFDKSIFYNLLGGLTQPIFDQGRNKTRYRIAQAQKTEAFNNYQQAVLNAGQEVSNALFSYQNALDKQQIRQNELIAAAKAVDFNKELLHYTSSTNYTDVLTSEQNLLAAQLNSVGDKLQELQAVVNIYRSLGGGWK